MQYRDFGKVDWKVSALGFGCMRLPTTDGKPSGKNINEREATRMVRKAIDDGVNYLDTAYPYHGGRSEGFLAKALKDDYREMTKVATKSPVWLIKKQKDFDVHLSTQMRRLKTNHIDFYLLHALNKKVWRDTILKHNVLERAEGAARDGKIGKLGFSFHDDFDAFREIIDGYDGWDFCQIQYNFIDVANQAGTKGLKYAASKGLGVIVMEPLLGGKLANPPARIRNLFREHEVERSPADLALQWIWDQPEVSTILSGMNTMRQVNQNIGSARLSGSETLTRKERQFIELLRSEYKASMPISCTKCGYCVPCPHGVDIPGNFELYNDGYAHDDMPTSRRAYELFMEKKQRASSCKKCGKCEKKCPQKLPIVTLMPKVHSVLGRGLAAKSR
jgi:predicted aldo/keto reductase-like oxidoreductase